MPSFTGKSRTPMTPWLYRRSPIHWMHGLRSGSSGLMSLNGRPCTVGRQTLTNNTTWIKQVVWWSWVKSHLNVILVSTCPAHSRQPNTASWQQAEQCLPCGSWEWHLASWMNQTPVHNLCSPSPARLEKVHAHRWTPQRLLIVISESVYDGSLHLRSPRGYLAFFILSLAFSILSLAFFILSLANVKSLCVSFHLQKRRPGCS